MTNFIKIKSFCLLVIALILGFELVWCQTNFKLDSLHRELKLEKNATQKGQILDKIIDVHFWNNRKTASIYIQKLLNHGHSTSDYYSLHRAYFYKVLALKPNTTKDSVFIYLEKAIHYGKLEKNTAHTCEGLIKLADYYLFFNKHKKAEKLLQESLSIAKKNNDTKYICRTLNALGKQYQNKKMHAQAFKYFSEVEKVLLKTNGDKNTLGENKMNIGDMYRSLHLPNQSRNNYQDALKLFTKTENGIGIMHALKSIGILDLEEGKFNKAENHFLKVYKFYENHEFRSNFANIASLLGKLYTEKKEYTKAEEKLNEALSVYRTINHSFGEIETLVNFSSLNEQKREFNAAKNNLELALQLSKKEKINNFEGSIYLKLAEVYEKTNNSNQSIYFYKKHNALNDSLAKLNQNQVIFEQEIQNINDKKNMELELLKSKKQFQIYFVSGLLLLILIISVFYYFFNKNKIKTASKLNELNELKSRFFANISHEFRTPLTLIKSPVESLKIDIQDANQKNKLDLIERNSNRMLELVDQLLELSKIDSGNLQLLLKEGNISSFLHSIVESFEYQSRDNKIKFVVSIENSKLNHHFDKDVIEKIVTNLLTNAFKYTPENEVIKFSSSLQNNELKLVVSNSGSEIENEDLTKLFERFYQKKENHHGVGIGLALVKELVELYKGKIESEVKENVLSFSVVLPIEKSKENAIVITKESAIEKINSQSVIAAELPILLIVDDNAEIRSLLNDIFKNDFKILEAENGALALKIAKKEIPDIIISDVMMPEMDGFQLTHELKNNELTSFIPIILLTAKTDEKSHLKGLKSEADSYLTKPFNNDILKASVANLIQERKKLQEHYSQKLVLKPIEISIHPVEERFIERIQQVLEKEITNTDFSTDDFASAVGMSRMQLHRKLKSLFGVSATEFVRNERLKIAALLLKGEKTTISEIAYGVGFNDVSYFSKCFKEVYLCTPTEYQERA